MRQQSQAARPGRNELRVGQHGTAVGHAPGSLRPGSGLDLGPEHLRTDLPFIDASPLYNSANFSRQAITPGERDDRLDRTRRPLVSQRPVRLRAATRRTSITGLRSGTGIVQHHTSYGGCQGTWSIEILPQNPYFVAQGANMNGTIFCCSSVRLADISDGTGTTILFAETSYGRMPNASDLASARWWNVGFVADSMISAYYPLNGALKGVPYVSGNYDNWIIDRRELPPRRGQRRLLRWLGPFRQGFYPVFAV